MLHVLWKRLTHYRVDHTKHPKFYDLGKTCVVSLGKITLAIG